MVIYPKKLILKDATKITVRPAEKEDLEDLFSFFSRIPRSDLLIYKDDVTRWETIESWFMSTRYNKILQLVALKGSEIVGKGTLHKEGLYWHNAAELKLIISPDCRARGLGLQMFKILLAESLVHGFEKVIVRYAVDNKSFMRILDHFGFKPEAVLRRYISDEHAKGCRDLVVASYDLKDWQGRFEFYNHIYDVA
ncbi:MAG: GNAT family N-acetyltransferase [Deltaproteobacteria bacterium]|nr:GNAT family N-acetyltransferase [Deltaproteobacteria bacterium]